MVIGMDIGGTTARICLCESDGRVLFEGEGKGGTLAGVGMEELHTRLSKVVTEALNASGSRASDCTGLCVGASGVDSEQDQKAYEKLFASLGFPMDQTGRFRVMNDGELLLRMFSGPAIVLISGTGSIALGAEGPESQVLRCGGWEHLLSDEGSGTWIGMEALKAYVRMADGRVTDRELKEQMEATTGIRCPEDAVAYCQEHIGEKADIAELAALVTSCAEHGAPACLDIVERAAGELASLVLTLSATMTDTGPLRLLFWGSVLLKTPLIRQRVAARVRAACQRIQPVLSEKTALQCAVLQARGIGSMPLRTIG